MKVGVSVFKASFFEVVGGISYVCQHTSVNFFQRRITTAFLLPLKAPFGNGKRSNPEFKGIESRGQERGAGNDAYDL